MESKSTNRIQDVFTSNIGVLSKISQYFGYAHQSAYLLYWLWSKSRKLLRRINKSFVYFFEPMKREVEFVNGNLYFIINPKRSKNETFWYLLPRVILNSYNLTKGLIKINEVFIQSVNIDLNLKSDCIKTLHQHFPTILSRFSESKLGISVDVKNNALWDSYFTQFIKKIGNDEWKVTKNFEFNINKGTFNLSPSLRGMLEEYGLKFKNLWIRWNYFVQNFTDDHFKINWSLLRTMEIQKLSIQIGSNSRYDNVDDDFHQFLEENIVFIKSLKKFSIYDRFYDWFPYKIINSWWQMKINNFKVDLINDSSSSATI